MPEVDRIEDAPDGELVADVHEGNMARGQGDLEAGGDEHHHTAFGFRTIRQQVGMTGPLEPGQGPGVLADGTGDDGVEFARMAFFPQRIGDGILDEKLGD